MALFNWFGKKPVENEPLIPEVVETIQEQSNEQDSPKEDEEKKKSLLLLGELECLLM